MPSSYDLAVAYRIYPKVAHTAIGLPLSDDKLRLADACLQSFRESLGGMRAKVWALLDGCPPEYGEMFVKCFDPQDLVIIPLDSIGNLRTFDRQIEILLHQTDAEFVYFAEDDYFYLPSQFATMMDFLRSHNDAHFVTPYDHADCYRLELHRHPQWLRVAANHHWRTAGSTCLTFLTTRRVLKETEHVFRTYAARNSDASLWLSLTQFGIWNPAMLARWAIEQPRLAKIVIKAWLYGWKQILFRRPRRLWVPVPGIATHMDANALSPSINWKSLIERRPPRTGQPLVSVPAHKS